MRYQAFGDQELNRAFCVHSVYESFLEIRDVQSCTRIYQAEAYPASHSLQSLDVNTAFATTAPPFLPSQFIGRRREANTKPRNLVSRLARLHRLP
jgi:hypothetical protein